MKQFQEFYKSNYKFYLESYWKNNDGSNIYRPNGFNELPEDIYKAFCEQIDKNGKVLDLECGNGLMLKYLIRATRYKLIPYGVDFLKPSIKQAREIIHPQYPKNFVVGNASNYSFKKGPFDFIFATINHIYFGDRNKYLEKIKKNSAKSGKVIFYEYLDVLRNKDYSWVGDFPELRNWNLSRKDYSKVSIGIWKK